VIGEMDKMKKIIILVLLVLFFYRDFLNPNVVSHNYFSDFRSYVGFMYDIYWAVKDGVPVWTDHAFTGVPLIGDLSAYHILYPPTIMFWFIQPEKILGLYTILHIILSAVFMYKLSKLIIKDENSALISAIIFIFGGKVVLTIAAGHLIVINGMPWIILSFYFTEKLLKKFSQKDFLLLWISMGLLFLSGHIQYFLYSLVAIPIYSVSRLAMGLKKSSDDEHDYPQWKSYEKYGGSKSS